MALSSATTRKLVQLARVVTMSTNWPSIGRMRELDTVTSTCRRERSHGHYSIAVVRRAVVSMVGDTSTCHRERSHGAWRVEPP